MKSLSPSRIAWLLARKLRTALIRGGKGTIRLASRIPISPYEPTMLTNDERVELNKNDGLAGVHAGKPAFVIGNGPSLGRVDLAGLAGQITFVANAFWKHPAVSVWQPSYYCLVDPIFFDRSDAMRDFFGALRERVQESRFLVPIYVHERLPTRDLVEREGWLAPNRTNYVAMGGSLADEIPRSIDATRIMPAVLNVAQFSIMMALFMGCSPIYLLGLDHDWLAKPGLDQHFYEGAAGLEKHPTLLQAQANSRYLASIERCQRLWNGYEHLNIAAGRAGVPIVNLTEGTFLDVFPVARLVDIVARHSH